MLHPVSAIEERFENLLLRRAQESGGKERIKSLLRAFGYDTEHWLRVVPYQTCFSWIEALGPEKLDVLEISGGDHTWQRLRFRSYRQANFPEFDICRDRLEESFDLIIADNVFEHVPYPWRAARNVHAMLNEGGHFLNLTPFMVKVHPCPSDCTRWTEEGIAYFLEDCGFDRTSIRTGSWGNRKCLRSNLRRWSRHGWWADLSNEPDFPLQVWALARK